MEESKYVLKFKAKINPSKHFGLYMAQHMVEEPEEDREEYLELVDFDSLKAICSAQRDGMPCEIVEEIFGQYNLIYDVEFEDGFRWIARIPLVHRQYQCDEDPEHQKEVRLKLFESMLASQTFARMKKSVFAPAIYLAFPDNDHAVGVPFFLMQKLGDWRLDETIGHKTDSGLRTTFSDLAREMVSLASPPYFSQIGSLFQRDNDFQVGPLLSYTSLLDDPVQLDKRGPYSTVEGYFLAALNRHTSTALRDANRELYYQVTRLRQMLPHFIDQRFNAGPFILSPFDWDGRHIFTSEDSTLSGLVDWDYATVVPLQAFFRYPTFMTRDWATGIKSPTMEHYRHVFRECLAELQDETELPLMELLDQSRWFSLFDEAVQSSELGRKALPQLEKAMGMQVESKKMEVKAIPVVRGMPILKEVVKNIKVGSPS